MDGTLPDDPFADAVEVPPSAAASPKRRFVMLDAAELAKPLPFVAPLVEGLGIAVGFPTCFAGYGYSRKTLAAQSLALSVASGQPLWGSHVVEQGRVVHLDYEQGDRTTRERYLRLARGMDIELSSLGKQLEVCSLPNVYLTDREAYDALVDVAGGAALVIVDSLRAATKGADENSSNIREPVDLLGRVSDATGAVVVMIHHARKPNQQGGGAKFMVRGSSALFDAFSSVFVFSAEKDGPTTVTHEKSRADGRLRDEFSLLTEDDEFEGDPRGALRVVQSSAANRPTSRFDELKERLVAAIAAEPGLKSKNAVHARVGGTRSSVLIAIDELIEADRIQQTDGGFVAVT